MSLSLRPSCSKSVTISTAGMVRSQPLTDLLSRLVLEPASPCSQSRRKVMLPSYVETAVPAHRDKPRCGSKRSSGQPATQRGRVNQSPPSTLRLACQQLVALDPLLLQELGSLRLQLRREPARHHIHGGMRQAQPLSPGIGLLSPAVGLDHDNLPPAICTHAVEWALLAPALRCRVHACRCVQGKEGHRLAVVRP